MTILNKSISLFIIALATLTFTACSKKSNNSTAGYPYIPGYAQCDYTTMDQLTYNQCISGYIGGYGNVGYYGAYPNNWFSYDVSVISSNVYRRFLEVHVNCNYSLTAAIGFAFGVSELTCDNLMSRAGIVVTTSDLTPSTAGYINIVAIANNVGSYWYTFYPQSYQKAFLPFAGNFKLNGNNIEFWSNQADLQLVIEGANALPNNGPINVKAYANGEAFLSGSLNFSYGGIPYGDNNYLPYQY